MYYIHPIVAFFFVPGVWSDSRSSTTLLIYKTIESGRLFIRSQIPVIRYGYIALLSANNWTDFYPVQSLRWEQYDHLQVAVMKC